MRLFFVCLLLFFSNAVFAGDGPQLEDVGIDFLDAITGSFRKYMRFMTGSFAPFGVVLAGVGGLMAYSFNAKGGLMNEIFKWLGVAIAALAIPSVVVFIQGLFY